MLRQVQWRGSSAIGKTGACHDSQTPHPVRRDTAALTAAVVAHAQESLQWPDTFVIRLEALALMQTLNAEILGSRSATLSLENCLSAAL